MRLITTLIGFSIAAGIGSAQGAVFVNNSSLTGPQIQERTQAEAAFDQYYGSNATIAAFLSDGIGEVPPSDVSEIVFLEFVEAVSEDAATKSYFADKLSAFNAVSDEIGNYPTYLASASVTLEEVALDTSVADDLRRAFLTDALPFIAYVNRTAESFETDGSTATSRVVIDGLSADQRDTVNLFLIDAGVSDIRYRLAPAAVIFPDDLAQELGAYGVESLLGAPSIRTAYPEISVDGAKLADLLGTTQELSSDQSADAQTRRQLVKARADEAREKLRSKESVDSPAVIGAINAIVAATILAVTTGDPDLVEDYIANVLPFIVAQGLSDPEDIEVDAEEYQEELDLLFTELTAQKVERINRDLEESGIRGIRLTLPDERPEGFRRVIVRDFSSQDWSDTTIAGIPNQPGSTTFAGSGGIVLPTSGGKPGSHLYTRLVWVNAPPGSVGAGAFQTYEGLVYDPGSDGPLNTVSYGASSRIRADDRSGQSRVSLGFAFGLVQNDVYYASSSFGVRAADPLPGYWQTLTREDRGARDFVRISEAGPDIPDFSENGAPIRFGFYVSASTGFTNANIQLDVDNFKIALSPQAASATNTQVPVPAWVVPLLLTLVIGSSIAMSSRSRQSQR